MRIDLWLGLSLLPACAWANPVNRPVWNQFERHVEPEDGAWFYASLPLTVPLGAGAVVVDTLIAHPIQVIDDAVVDASYLWEENDPDFEDAYYTEMAYLPFRTLFTPLVFTGSFVGRSLFDVGERMTAEERDARDRDEQHRQKRAFIAWLQQVDGDHRWPSEGFPDEWHPDFAAPMQAALEGDATRRRALHVGMLERRETVFGQYDAAVGLRDPDPIVRFAVLREWPDRDLPADLAEQLRSDPVESIRLLAARRFPE